MDHIDDKTLHRLAEEAMSGAQPKPEEETFLAHIRQCRHCYRRFAVLTVLLERLGVSETPQPFAETLLAAVHLTLNQAQGHLNAAFRRVEDLAGQITFVMPAPAVPVGARGADPSPRQVVRVDGTESEEDLIAYDTVRRMLTVQLSLQQHPGLKARVEVRLPDGRQIPLPLREEDGVLYGCLENFCEPDAEICLLQEEI